MEINGLSIEPERRQIGKAWSLSAYDLRKFRGRTVQLKGRLVAADNPRLPRDGKVQMQAWLVVDRKVDSPAVPIDRVIPLPITQDYRRQTQELIPKTAVGVAAGE